jgi:hypothetical protein
MKSIIRKKIKTLRKPISSKSKLMVLAEKRHIQAHLAVTELRLRLSKGNDINTRNKRTIALDSLNNYWRKGLFPKNTYDTNKRKPVFIDDSGTYCAVGYLMANTGNGDHAKEINNTNKFVLVDSLDDVKTNVWLKQNGFTQSEASLIQPGYGGYVIERVNYSVLDKVLAGLTIVACVAVIVIVVGVVGLLFRRSVPKSKKKKSLLAYVAVTAAIFASFVFFLPYPITAFDILIDESDGYTESLTCGGWGGYSDTRGICEEFENKGRVPGWREVPCEGICLL